MEAESRFLSARHMSFFYQRYCGSLSMNHLIILRSLQLIDVGSGFPCYICVICKVFHTEAFCLLRSLFGFTEEFGRLSRMSTPHEERRRNTASTIATGASNLNTYILYDNLHSDQPTSKAKRMSKSLTSTCSRVAQTGRGCGLQFQAKWISCRSCGWTTAISKQQASVFWYLTFATSESSVSVGND